ncbi:MAG: M16 family metallopeptidase [Thermoguttaceae bacterium]
MRYLENPVVAVCLLCLPASNLVAADVKPAMPEYTSVRHLAENVTLASLDNGLTVIVQENHTAPVATVRCYVKNTGSAFEGRYLGAGLSHVLEHVVSGGSTIHHSEKEIEKIIASFGGVTNAYTTNDHTTFFIDCPARNTMTAVELIADAMQHITFEPKEFARELKVVRRELADDEVDRGHVMADLLNLTVYAVHPARHPVIGYLQVLNGTTNQAIIDFYHERYVPNNQIFVVVGDVNTQDVLDHLARHWGTPRGRETFVALPAEPQQVSPRETVREMDGTVYDFTIAWPTVTLANRDMYALDLAAYILGEGESSRLVRQLKYENPLVLSVGATSNTPFFVRGYFAVTATSKPETWQKASEEILRQVYRLRDEEIGEAELAKAKKQKAAELVFQHQTVQQQAESLGQDYLGTSDPLFDRTYTDRIQAVTAAEIRAVAKKYFVPSRVSRVIIAPPGGGPKGAAESKAAGASSVRLVRLPNGLRVLVKRVPNLPLVNIQAYVLGGSSRDGEKYAGRSMLLAEMLDKGTQNGPTGAAIAQYFDSIGGLLSFNSGRFTLFGAATCLRDDFPKAAGLFADSFLHPAFPQDQFEKAQSLLLADIENRSADPHAEISELLFNSLPSSSPYHVNPEGNAETVKALTVADLKKFHAECFVPGSMVVTVFGDIEPEAAIALVTRHFGGLAAAAKKPAAGTQPEGATGSNAIPESKVVNKATTKDTAMLMLAYACEGIHDRADHSAMIVLRAILNGYSTPGGWLHNELRGEGLVYYVQSTELTGPVPGYFLVTSQTRPDKLDEVVHRIRRNLDRAREGEIPEDEFRTAIDQIVALHAQENVTIGEQARSAAIDELYGLGYDYDKKFDAQIQAVTLPDVVRVAQKYFTNSILVTSSPEKK